MNSVALSVFWRGVAFLEEALAVFWRGMTFGACSVLEGRGVSEEALAQRFGGALHFWRSLQCFLLFIFLFASRADRHSRKKLMRWVCARGWSVRRGSLL